MSKDYAVRFRVLSRIPSRVLLVEGDRSSAEAHRLALMMAGYGVDLARDGEEGIERLVQAELPDAVVVDLGLPRRDPTKPRRDALELLSSIRSARATNGLPVLVLAGDLTAVNEAMVRGATHGLVNWRTRPQDLNRKVAELLGVGPRP